MRIGRQATTLDESLRVKACRSTSCADHQVRFQHENREGACFEFPPALFARVDEVIE